MTANELFKKQVDAAAEQIGKVYTGMSEADLDYRALPTMMTAREIAEHYCECYVATGELCEGKSHEWGSYAAADKTWPALSAEMNSLRAKAIEAVLAADSDEKTTEASFFIVGHDNYHIGQLCSIRLALDPNWNPYSIYNM